MNKHGGKGNKGGGGFPYKKGGAVVAEEKKVVDYSVDTDANPQVPAGLKFGKHERMGTMKVVIGKDGELHIGGRVVVLVPCEDSHGIMLPYDVILANLKLRPLNASVRDFLNGNGTLIPPSWDGKNVFFPNTEFTTPNGNPCLPYLYPITKAMWSAANLEVPRNPKDTYFGKKAYIAAF